LAGELKHDQARVAEEVGWAVTRAVRHVPFNAVCLPQAMAARIMLKRRSVENVLYFDPRIGQAKPIDRSGFTVIKRAYINRQQ
jgi:hypothetical protein